jgi:hypothetical protein
VGLNPTKIRELQESPEALLLRSVGEEREEREDTMMNQPRELSFAEKLELPCHICNAHAWEYCSGLSNMNEGIHHDRGFDAGGPDDLQSA